MTFDKSTILSLGHNYLHKISFFHSYVHCFKVWSRDALTTISYYIILRKPSQSLCNRLRKGINKRENKPDSHTRTTVWCLVTKIILLISFRTEHILWLIEDLAWFPCDEQHFSVAVPGNTDVMLLNLHFILPLHWSLFSSLEVLSNINDWKHSCESIAQTLSRHCHQTPNKYGSWLWLKGSKKIRNNGKKL